ncbi:MAG: hypothetical protein AB7I27_02360 [Bacteriovoracaceae bacterium]
MKFFLIYLGLLTSTTFAATIDLEGTYSISGVHTSKGAYQGEIEIRPQMNGFSVVRVITYESLEFKGLKVQEVWTGKISDSSKPHMTFSLKQADYITRYNDKKRSLEEFKKPYVVRSKINLKSEQIELKFVDKSDEVYSEILSQKTALNSNPIWQNLRRKIMGNGGDMPTFVKPLILLSKHRSKFEDDTFAKMYLDRNEYKRGSHYIIFDPTDYEFYQENPDKIRVANKVLDEISLMESLNRRNAYVHKLDSKADYYEQNLRERHLPESTGMLAIAKVSPDNKLEKYLPDFSAGLWSGLYAGSQAMRYLNTGEPEALETFKKVLKGVMTLIDITNDSSQFARAIAPYDPEQISQGWIQGRNEFSHLMYMPEGNNDMFKGISHILMWAIHIIPEDDQETWDLLRKKSLQILNLKVIKDKPQNKAAAYGIASIIHNDAKLEKKFRNQYKSPKVILGGFSFDTSFYIEGSADWSGINLRVVGLITDMMIAQRIGAINISNQLKRRLIDTWVTYETAKRPLVTMAAYAFAYKYGIVSNNFKNLEGNEARFKESLENTLWNLRAIPIPRPTQDIEIDHSLDPDWCLSPMPQLFWKAYMPTPPPAKYFFQGILDYPIFEQLAYTSNYFWKDSPFDFQAAVAPGIESSGADYLYLYWMMKYSGLDWN